MPRNRRGRFSLRRSTALVESDRPQDVSKALEHHRDVGSGWRSHREKQQPAVEGAPATDTTGRVPSSSRRAIDVVAR